PAGLLAAGLGLGGGCYTLDAACASSLYAIKLACEELISGRADAVLTGGASRPSSQFTQMGFSQLRALSKSGVCRPFDKRADGLLVGEGAGMFMLKRLDDAIASNDKIYGIIRGIGLSNDVGGSLLAPDKEGQVRAMRAAYAQAHWSPADIQLIECHGTGTPKGDAVEVSSIKEILQGTDSKECVIGSVKSNVGHLLTGAGAAGLMKLVFALKNKQLPPTAGYEIPDEKLELENTPIRILQKPKAWNPAKDGEPRRCALSAFGFGGINAHVLIEEYIKDKSLITANFKTEKLPEVAIVAMNTMVGDLKNLKEFQEAVLNCAPAKKPISAKRKQSTTDIPWLQEGAFIDEVDVTPGEFKISPIEIPEVLPQQLLMLKTVSGALKFLVGKEHSRLKWGTYIGISQDFEASNFASRWAIKKDSKAFGLNNYDEKQLCDSITPPLNNARTIGALGGIVASRIAREYSIGGPSHTFSSAENSGLSALEAAVRALQRNEIDTAIVGAVDFAGDMRNMLASDKLRPYSRKSSSTPFEKDTDGAFPGEGAGAVILKRKEDAIKDGDVIFSIIKGFGKGSSNHFEDKDSLKSAYEKAISQAWNESGFKPENIGLLETNGSGFPSEDKIEAEAIADFMPIRPDNKEDTFKNNDQLCALSSTKMVTGHTGAASGLLSLIKAAICLHQQILPAFKTLKNPIEALNKRKDSFFTPNQPQFWLRNKI
ncbi:MAG: polyketide synthase, partial [Candidatus Riflebacteria bacterium]|nr:polyketide synthase [Candidatus Riflebacteria bacterium]